MALWELNKPIIDNITGFPTLTHVQREFNWDLVLPDLWGFLVTGIIVSRYCQSVKFGPYNMDASELVTGPIKQHYAGALNIQTMTATFINPIPDIVSIYFSAWKRRIVDNSGYWRPGSDYKKNVHIMLYDRSGIPSNMITLKGAFPVGFPAYDLSYGGDKEHRFTIEFKFDGTSQGFSSAAGILGEAGSAIGQAAGRVGKFVKKVIT
jgi:hypothetical protein